MLGSEIRVGDILSIDKKILKVKDRCHTQTGMGKGYLQITCQDINNGKKIEMKIRVDEKVDKINIFEKKGTFAYIDGSQYIFIDEESCSSIFVEKDRLNKKEFLTEGQEIILLFTDSDEFLDIKLPKTVVCSILSTPEHSKRQTATPQEKFAELTNGIRIKVPAYVKDGDKVEIDVESLEFLKRVN